MPEKKNSQRQLLLLLLLLVALFAYLYFFTGLIRPRPEEPQPQPQQAAGQLVKQPMPPRPAVQGEPAAAGAKSAANAPAPKGAPEPPQEAKPAEPEKGAPPAKGAQAVKPAPEAKAAKPAPASPQAKAEKGGKGAPAAEPKAKEAKGTPVAEPKAKGGAGGAKPEAKAPRRIVVERSARAKVAKPKGAARGSYALEIEGDLPESEANSVAAKLKQAGVGHLVKSKAQKGEPMHRLFLADFGNRDEALEELERLKLAAPNAFMLKENGRYAVYAGSYMREGKAAVEQDRLYDKGVKLLLKTATAPVPVVRLRAGSFGDQASAEKAVRSLKKSGVTAKVVKVGN